jgi:hypothetical protein
VWTELQLLKVLFKALIAAAGAIGITMFTSIDKIYIRMAEKPGLFSKM